MGACKDYPTIDRIFFYLTRDIQTGTFLFLGRVL